MNLMARLAVAEGRLAAFAENPPPGLTDPDPATGEQWDAGRLSSRRRVRALLVAETQKVQAAAERGQQPSLRRPR
jgi:hypothetical protein